MYGPVRTVVGQGKLVRAYLCRFNLLLTVPGAVVNLGFEIFPNPHTKICIRMSFMSGILRTC